MMASGNNQLTRFDRAPHEAAHDIMSCIDYLLGSFAELCSSKDPSKQLANLDLRTVVSRTTEILGYVHTLQNRTLPVMQLPPEVLGTIFEMLPRCAAGHPSDITIVNSRLPDRSIAKWMKVRLVCRRWHDVAASHATLWTTIFANMETCRRYVRQAQPELIQLFLRNSRQAPLNISLTNMLSAREVTSALTEILEPHIPRIQELEFTLPETPSPDVLRLLTHSSAPILQGLDLDLHLYFHIHARHNLPTPTSLPALFQDNTPALRCLSIDGFLSSAKYNFRNLRQLKLSGLIYRDNWTGLVDMMNLSPTLEDLMFCGPVRDLGFPTPVAITPRLYLSNLKKLVFNKADRIFSLLLSQCDIPLNVYVYGSMNMTSSPPNDSFSGGLRRCGPHLQDINKLKFVFEHRYTKIYASGNSFALQYWKTRCLAEPIAVFMAELLGRVQELWVDGFCSDIDDILATARNTTKLYCATLGVDDWLSALRHPTAASLGGDLPCLLLREIHLLRPQHLSSLVPAIEEMLSIRHALGCPLDVLYFYLPLPPQATDAGDPDTDEWQAIVLRTLQPHVRVEIVRTDTLPHMQAPAHCMVQSGGGWDWPTWDANRR